MCLRTFKLFCTLVLTLSSAQVFAIGSNVAVSSFQFVEKGSSYTGLGQSTRELRSLQDDHIFVDYTLESFGRPPEKRRLWDDDGLATLFIYHRGLTTQVYNKELSESSPLAQPVTPLIKALDLLKTTYQSTNRPDIVTRVNAVSKSLLKARVVSDIRDSGLESLINDLNPNHTYKVEVGEDKSIRKKVSELVAVGSPSSITDSVASRCKDNVITNWQSAIKEFIKTSPSGGGSSLPGRSSR